MFRGGWVFEWGVLVKWWLVCLGWEVKGEEGKGGSNITPQGASFLSHLSVHFIWLHVMRKAAGQRDVHYVHDVQIPDTVTASILVTTHLWKKNLHLHCTTRKSYHITKIINFTFTNSKMKQYWVVGQLIVILTNVRDVTLKEHDYSTNQLKSWLFFQCSLIARTDYWIKRYQISSLRRTN